MLKDIRESRIAEADGDVVKGTQQFAGEILEMVKKGELEHNRLSIKDLYENVVLPVRPELQGNGNPDAVALSEAINTTQFPKIMGEVIRRELIPAYEKSLLNAQLLVREMETNRTDYEYMAGIKAKSGLERVKEGMKYPYGDFGEKNVRVEIAKFGEIIGVTKETIMMDKTGQILAEAADGGETMGAHRHRYIIETVTDAPRNALGESTSTAMYADGSTRDIYADTHATWQGYANDNVSASSAITTYANWKTVRKLFAAMQDENGDYINARPTTVLCNDLYELEAWEAIRTNQEWDTGNNAANYFKSNPMAIVTSPWVGQASGQATTNWYMGNFTKQFAWFWAERPTVISQGRDSNVAFEQDIVSRYRYSYMGGCGAFDTRFVVEATA